MSKASYQTKQSRYIGLLNRGPYPKRWITLKVYRMARRTRHRESKKLWKKTIDAWSRTDRDMTELDPYDLG